MSKLIIYFRTNRAANIAASKISDRYDEVAGFKVLYDENEPEEILFTSRKKTARSLQGYLSPLEVIVMKRFNGKSVLTKDVGEFSAENGYAATGASQTLNGLKRKGIASPPKERQGPWSLKEIHISDDSKYKIVGGGNGHAAT